MDNGLNEIISLELTEDEQVQLESAARSLEIAEQAIKNNELLIAQIQTIQTQVISDRNAFAATYFRILSNHKLTELECFPTPDKKGINIRLHNDIMNKEAIKEP
jgi:pantothenate synthetase